MSRINLRRVVFGGLVAGSIIAVGEFVMHGVVLREEWQAAREGLELGPLMNSAVSMLIVMLVVLGVLAVWLYAVIRSKFGPGPRTAVYAGLFVWILAYIWPTTFNNLGPVWPPSLLMIGTVFGLVLVPVATAVGAWFYKEAGGGGRVHDEPPVMESTAAPDG